MSGATGYNIQYRQTGTATWSNTTSTTSSTSSTDVSGLNPASTYEFQVQTICSATAISAFSTAANFTILATTVSALPVPDHIVILILENHNYASIIGSLYAPHINVLANDGSSALFTHSFAIEHPSQPNYLDLYSGSNQGITDDNLPSGIPFMTANLGRELIDASHSFATYSEDLPSVGYNGETWGAYARKHNPAANWMGTGQNQIPLITNQPFTAFPKDFTQLPTVSYVIPNQDNDMHNGTDPSTITTADNWMYNNLNNYIEWAKAHNSLFILTFDEDDDSQNNHIVTIFNGAMVAAGTYSDHIDHYNILSTIEDIYGLPHAGNASSAISNCWKTNTSAYRNSISYTRIQQALNTAIYKPKAFNLSISPNPVNTTTKVKFDIPVSGKILLKVYNSLGQPVKTLFEGEKNPGSYTIVLNASTLGPGVYYCKLGSYNILTEITKKLIIIK